MEQECYSCDWSEKPYIKISTLASAASRKSYIHDYILQKCRGAQIRKVALFPQQKAVPSMPPTDPSCCLTTFREGKAPPPGPAQGSRHSPGSTPTLPWGHGEWEESDGLCGAASFSCAGKGGPPEPSLPICTAYSKTGQTAPNQAPWTTGTALKKQPRSLR